jgi:TRAP-type uncharacterized transport system substrate-binding protein
LYFAVHAALEIKSVPDLKGKNIAVSTAGGNMEIETSTIGI